MIVDPISKLSAPTLKLGESLLKHSTPVRVGLVLAPVANTQEDIVLETAARAAFNYVAQERSYKEAFHFLAQVNIDILFITYNGWPFKGKAIHS